MGRAIVILFMQSNVHIHVDIVYINMRNTTLQMSHTVRDNRGALGGPHMINPICHTNQPLLHVADLMGFKLI